MSFTYGPRKSVTSSGAFTSGSRLDFLASGQRCLRVHDLSAGFRTTFCACIMAASVFVLLFDATIFQRETMSKVPSRAITDRNQVPWWSPCLAHMFPVSRRVRPDTYTGELPYHHYCYENMPSDSRNGQYRHGKIPNAPSVATIVEGDSQYFPN